MPPVFTPTAKQALLHDIVFSPGNDEILFGGARGGAKTAGGVWMGFELSVIFPGNKGLIVRKDFNDLKETTMDEFDKFMTRYYPAIKCRWNRSSPASVEFQINGATSSIIFSEAKDSASLLSQNLGWMLIEEAIEVSEDFYLETSGAVGRVVVEVAKVPEPFRHLLTDEKDGWAHPPARILFTTNPGSGWIKRGFPVGNGRTPGKRRIEKEWRDRDGIWRKTSILRVFLPSFIADNPHLPADYEGKLRAKYGEAYARRMLDGDWSAFEGQVFTELDPVPGGASACVVKADVVDQLNIPASGWQHFFTVDWGYRSPTVALNVSIDFSGGFWIWREYRKSERTPEQHAPHFAIQIEDLPKGKLIHLLDAAATDQSDGVTIREQFNQMPGYRWQFLGPRKHKTGPDGSIVFTKKLMQNHKFHIDERCAGAIREFTEAQWEPQTANSSQKENPTERMLDKDDHSIDAFFGAVERYRMVPSEASPSEEQQVRARRRQAEQESASNVLTRRTNDGGYEPVRRKRARL